MKYTRKDILKIEAQLRSIIDHTECREERFGKEFVKETTTKIRESLQPLRSIANAVELMTQLS